MKADEESTANWSILNCLNYKVKTEAFQSTLLLERAYRYSPHLTIKSFREIITSISLEIREIIIESKNTLSITQENTPFISHENKK